MPSRPVHRLLPVVLCCLVLSAATAARAQNRAPGDYDALLERLERAEAEIERLKQSEGMVQPIQHTVDGNPAAWEGPNDPPATQQQLNSLEHKFEEFRESLTRKKYPTAEIHGAVQMDTGWFHQDANSHRSVGDLQDGADFRRARLGVNGSIVENVNYFIQMDFAFPGRPTFTDVWMEFTKVPLLGNVRVGQWKQPFSLEVVSSFRYTTFPERSLLFQSFAPFRHIAMGFYDNAEDEMSTWAASVYRSGQDQFGDSIADNGGYAGVGRLTHLMWWEDEGARYLHVGGAYNWVAPVNRLAAFRTIPEFFIGQQGATVVGTAGVATPTIFDGIPFFVNTGNFRVNHYNLVGTELLWVDGPLSLQSEFMYLSATRSNGVGANFAGFYATLGYFLTGEHRPYLRKLGAIDRLKPNSNFTLGASDDEGAGWGAWEVATRWSYIDLNSKDIRGGRLNDFTAGLNWYLNAYAKIQFHYIRAMLANPTFGNSDTNMFGVRAQFDF